MKSSDKSSTWSTQPKNRAEQVDTVLKNYNLVIEERNQVERNLKAAERQIMKIREELKKQKDLKDWFQKEKMSLEKELKNQKTIGEKTMDELKSLKTKNLSQLLLRKTKLLKICREISQKCFGDNSTLQLDGRRESLTKVNHRLKSSEFNQLSTKFLRFKSPDLTKKIIQTNQEEKFHSMMTKVQNWVQEQIKAVEKSIANEAENGAERQNRAGRINQFKIQELQKQRRNSFQRLSFRKINVDSCTKERNELNLIFTFARDQRLNNIQNEESSANHLTTESSKQYSRTQGSFNADGNLFIKPSSFPSQNRNSLLGNANTTNNFAKPGEKYGQTRDNSKLNNRANKSKIHRSPARIDGNYYL